MLKYSKGTEHDRVSVWHRDLFCVVKEDFPVLIQEWQTEGRYAKNEGQITLGRGNKKYKGLKVLNTLDY